VRRNKPSGSAESRVGRSTPEGVVSPRIVGLGLCVVDHSYLVDELADDPMRLRYRERRVDAGGMVGNALRQVAALGCEAHILSGLGDDSDGRMVRSGLRAAGVRTQGLMLSPRLITTVAVVLVDRKTGERRFVVPDRRRLEARAPAFELSEIERCQVLMVDGHFPAQALRAVRQARKAGVRVVADFHRMNRGVERLLPYVDHAIVSEEFVAAAGYGSPREALRVLARVTRGQPVVTRGARGGLTLEGRQFRRFAAHRARVVDTTGAGDVFHGAVAAGLSWSLDFADCLDLGARAAAHNCAALGGAGRLMTRDELPAALRRAALRSRRGP